VINILFVGVFYTKIIHNECELDEAADMLPQAGGMTDFIVSFGP